MDFYSGITSGSHDDAPGNGANYLCLPEDPIYDQVQAGVDTTAFIYSSEYRRVDRFTETTLGQMTIPQCPLCRLSGQGKERPVHGSRQERSVHLPSGLWSTRGT